VRPMSEAVQYMIMDMETGNSVAFFDDHAQAESAFRQIVHEHPSERQNLALVAFDKQGYALATELASDLAPTLDVAG
jgi:hypothetical protein